MIASFQVVNHFIPSLDDATILFFAEGAEGVFICMVDIFFLDLNVSSIVPHVLEKGGLEVLISLLLLLIDQNER